MSPLTRDALGRKILDADSPEGKSGVKRDGDTVTVTLPAGENPKLGDYDEMLRERGLDPADWTVIAVKANEWDAMTSAKATGDNRIVRMRQWTITLKPVVAKVLLMPAVHVPAVKRRARQPGPAASQRPELIVVESDHHAPYHDPQLHEASLNMIAELHRRDRLTDQVFLGDTLDLPLQSNHKPHPAAMASGRECIQGGYNILRAKREAAPNCRARKIKGNHDWRLESYQLEKAIANYGLAPATEWEAKVDEIPALDIRRLLHLDKLGIELLDDPRGWQHGEIELVPGPYGLVGRHGWLTGENTAEKSVKARGRSIIFGHIHRREHAFVWDPSMECERIGVATGTMSLARDPRHPHFVTLDRWLQGCVLVTHWPDGDFQAEHVRWNGVSLRWRDRSWYPDNRPEAA